MLSIKVKLTEYKFFRVFNSQGSLGACLAGICLLTLMGCGSFSSNRQPMPPCPKIFLLKDANTLTVFDSKKGMDIIDIISDISIINFKGQCGFNKKRTGVNLSLRIVFDVSRGPANKNQSVSFDYFVAIPKFHPSPSGKKIFPINVMFKGNKNRMKLIDRVEIKVPISTKYDAKDYSIYIGIQLTPKQLKYNRQQMNQNLRR
ncbi:MAG: hypothetical protein CMM83_06630 [Rhodospirillales bacterium]|nr:hypothetical protein [Rhodospirillales bacterium]